jgi:transcription termination/antitermination protein NusA
MHSKELIESFEDFAKSKNIDRPTMVKVLEEVFRTMIRKKYGTDENFDVIINADSGDLEMWRTREIVDDNSEDIWDFDKIPLEEAKKIEPDFEVGEEVAEEVKLDDFGRRMVQTARQTLIQKIKDLEKEILVQHYNNLIGELVTGEVYQILSKEIIVMDSDGNELIMPKNEQIYKDRFRKGQSVRAVIERIDPNNGNPKIIISRTSPSFLERLFELEIPEILDGLISVKKIVREPGERAKVAVESFDDRIDPVGACVGMKGSRIHSIVRELENENIDVIQFTENIGLLIQRALSPAKVTRVMPPDYTKKRVSVFLNQDQVSMAIGKGGQNIKLAGKLVDLEIDVFKEKENEDEDEEDIDLAEFDDEIDQWIISEFRKIGLDTAKQVLALTVPELARRTELEEETIEEVMSILRREFE